MTILAFLVTTVAALPGAEPYLDGREAERVSKYGDAVAAYEVCIAGNGPLAPYARLRTAYCRSQGGDPDGAVAAYRRLLDEQPDGPWKLMARVYLAALHAKHDNPAAAEPLYASFLALSPQVWWFDRYAWHAAENRLNLPEMENQAYAHFRQVAETTRFLYPRRDAAKRLAKSPSLDDRLAAALGLMRAGSYTDSRGLLLACATEMAETDVSPRDLDACILAAEPAKDSPLGKRLAAHPHGEVLARAWLAYTVRHTITAGNLDLACAACDLMLDRYQHADETPGTLWRLARQFERDDKPRKAVVTVPAPGR